MPRIRYLKPDFFKDEDLAEHPYWVRLLFAGLWGIADKEGRLEDRAKRIKAEVFPYDNVDIEKGLVELSKKKQYGNQPFIQRYQSNGENFIQIINWDKHQKPHHTEKESTIPPAPPLNTMEKGMEKQHEASAALDNGYLTVKQLNINKNKYLEFVWLTLEEYQKLVENFGDKGAQDKIAALNNYIGSKGTKYKSHYHTILSWARKDPVVKEQIVNPLAQRGAEVIKKVKEWEKQQKDEGGSSMIIKERRLRK